MSDAFGIGREHAGPYNIKRAQRLVTRSCVFGSVIRTILTALASLFEGWLVSRA